MNRRYLIACVVLLVLVLGLLAALAIHRRALSLEQARAVSEIEKMGGRIEKSSSTGYVTSVWLHGIQVTDVGLEHLTGLTQLQVLDLSGTQVTDAGLEHLKGLTQLQVLNLGGTKVTDAGLKDLQNAMPWVSIQQHTY